MKELELIKYIQKKAGKSGKGVQTGIGDDCAVLDYNSKEYLLWATDMLVENTHFKLKTTDLKAIGRKAVMVNVSDIAAMGGMPKHILISIGVPEKIKSEEIKKIYDGIFRACKEYKIDVLGGDTVKSKKLVINVSIIGFVEKKRLTLRDQARPGELIVITGPVRNGKKTHLNFVPRLEEAVFLTRNYKIGAMIDVSDGLAIDANRVCDASEVGCRIFPEDIPLSSGLSLKDALYYGESFEILFTMKPSEVRKLFSKVEKQKDKLQFHVIGEVVSKKDGKVLVDKNGEISQLKNEGYRHL